MADTEIESMVVKLKGDADSYDKMVKDAMKSIKSLTATMGLSSGEQISLAKKTADAMVAEQKKAAKEQEKAAKEAAKEIAKAQKEAAKEAEKNSIGANANAAWAIMEKSFIQSIRAVDARFSRTVASITNGLEGIVRVSIAAGGNIAAAWGKVFENLGLGGLSKVFSTPIKMVGDFGSLINKSLGGIPSAIGSTFAGVSQVIGTVFAGAFGIAAAVVIEFGREIQHAFTETLNLDKEARNLGVSILDLRAGVMRFGVSSQTMGNAIGSVQSKLSQFRDGVDDAGKDIKQLSMVSGKSVQSISSGWEGVFNAIAAIPDETQRAAQAFRFLGSSASEFLRELDRGGMGDARGMAKRLGLEVGPQDQENLRQIAEFIRQTEALKTGLVNQVMLGLAPIAAELSEMFSLSKTDITWIKNTVTAIGLEIAKWGAVIGTAFSNTEAFGQMVKIIKDGFLDAADAFWAYMEKKAAQFVTGNSYWMNFGSGVLRGAGAALDRGVGGTGGEGRGPRTTISDFMRMFADSPLIQQFNRLNEGVNRRTGAGMNILGNPFLSGVAGGIGGMTGGLGSMVPPWLKDIGQTLLNAPLKTTPPVEIDKLNQAFNSLIASLKQPIDAWKDSLKNLKRFTDKGFFIGKGDEQAIAASNMFKTLKESTGMSGPPQFAGAATAQSTEAYSAIAQFQAMRDRGGIQEQMKAAIEQGNRQRELLINNGKAVIEALNTLGEKIDDADEGADI